MRSKTLWQPLRPATVYGTNKSPSSYLLGLDWRIPSDLQGLRGKEKIVKELGRAARSGDLGTFVGRAADIRTRLAVAERKIERLSSQLQTFQVIPEYRELQTEAKRTHNADQWTLVRKISSTED